MKYVLALDQGTTSSRAILFDRDANPVAVAQEEIRQHYPQPGWVEHDPDEIWQSQSRVAVEALAKAGAARDDVAAIGIANQRETTILWDRRSGEAVGRAIVWQDRRTAGLCETLKEQGLSEKAHARTGLFFDPYFSGTKLRWMLDNVEGARARAERGELAFGTVDAWLIWRLTGGARHVTDAGNASRTLLYDLHRGCWDDEMLAVLDVPAVVLPQVVDSSGVAGEVAEPSELAGLPIAGIAGDQQAALFGQACFAEGMAKNTYGTGCFLLMYTGAEPVASRNNLLTTVAWRIGGKLEYALEGSVFVGGALVKWLRDGLGLIESSSEIEALASRVSDSGGVYVVPAFAGLGAPHWDACARGAILGLDLGSTSAHVARAALEGIAFQSHDVLQAMQEDAGIRLRELRVDGGASVNDLLMQFQADVSGVPVVRPKVSETTALGAAYLAGLAVGFWPDRDAIAAGWRPGRTYTPKRAPESVASALAGWRRAVERAKGWHRV